MDVGSGEIPGRDRRLRLRLRQVRMGQVRRAAEQVGHRRGQGVEHPLRRLARGDLRRLAPERLVDAVDGRDGLLRYRAGDGVLEPPPHGRIEATERSEEHTSELQSLMRISYAVFCLKKQKKITT